MAKYLGGIKDPDISNISIHSPGLLAWNYMMTFQDSDSRKCVVLAESIVSYEELTAESHKDYSLTWGALGYLAAGPAVGIAGAILGGSRKEKHIVLCELSNGWRFGVELDKEEFRSWESIMSSAVKANNKKN